jgi:hypothetical protein
LIMTREYKLGFQDESREGGTGLYIYRSEHPP